MTQGIKREILLPQSREEVWRALTDSAALAEWMYPNDFEPRIGHCFTFCVPWGVHVGFDGVVRCEVLECSPPSVLVYSWSGGPVVDSRVSYRLEPHGSGTQMLFEHSGFDLTRPFGKPAFRGAELGWARMLEQLSALLQTRCRTP
jgi:uncharacterized protein YndB with AHSA1/START domain